MNILKYILGIFVIGLALSVGTGELAAQEKSESKQESKQKKEDSKESSDKELEQQKENGDEKDDDGDLKEEKKSDDKKSEDDDEDDQKKDNDKKDDKEKSGDDKKPAAQDEKTSRASRTTLRKMHSKRSESFVKVFEPVVSSVNGSTLQVLNGKRQIALGTVVDSNGFILTKASELKGELGCKLGDGTIVKAVVHGVDAKSDLALLKIEADNLSEAPWSDDAAPTIGHWLASPMSDKSEPIIGVVSVNEREIPRSRAFIGIQMVDTPEEELGVRITSIVSRSPAAYADLKEDDVIYKIDDKEINNVAELIDTIGNHDINDRIALAVKRDGKEMTINLTLAERDKVSPENQRSNTQNSMGSTLSQRRKDFPLAFQHDAGLNNNTCGGPIVDLTGKIVGINIARAGRVSSLALPVNTVRPIIAMLKSGNYAPAIINKEKIKEIDFELEELTEKVSALPSKKAVLDNRYQREKGRVEELERNIRELQERLKSIKGVAGKKKKELDIVRREIFNIEKTRQRLEADRRQLSTGSR